MIFNIEVNKQVITARKGDSILTTLRKNGIVVPTLCNMESFTPTGACRMCVVEIEGRHDLVTACSHTVEEWMKIKTHSPRVIRARRTIVELLLSSHPDDCLYCIRNGQCELQDYARELGIRERRLPIVKPIRKKDPSSASVVRDPAKCILCGRCIRVCKDRIGISTLDFIGKGMETVIGPVFNRNLNLSNCIDCGQCIMVCPTGALHEKDQINLVMEALQNPQKHVVVQVSPTVSVSLAEEFGSKTGKDLNGHLVGILRKMGFDRIFKTAFAADVMISIMVDELMTRLENNQNLPMFSSDCPAFNKYMEEYHHDLLSNISVSKSPQQIMGSLIKYYYSKEYCIDAESIFSVSLMPCTAKKFEAIREENTAKGISDVDAVITTRELIRMIRLFGLDMNQTVTELADQPFALRSSAAKIIGISGGLAEAVYRSFYYKITGKLLPNLKVTQFRSNKNIREMHLKAGKYKVGFASVNGLEHVKEIISRIRNGKNDLAFIEVKACPGGCINGGGQPIIKNQDIIRSRVKTLYDIDDTDPIQVSYKNAAAIELLRKIKDSGREVFEQQFCTSYQKRDVLR